MAGVPGRLVAQPVPSPASASSAAYPIFRFMFSKLFMSIRVELAARQTPLATMLTKAILHTLAAGLLGALPATAQPAPTPSPLPQLLAERRVLTQHYAEANAQRHGLLGLSNKPSKQDLQEVVDALQGIVNKDEQIVAVLNQTTQQAQTTAAQLQTTTTTLQNTSRDDRNLTTQRLSELQNDLQNAQQRERQAAERQRTLAADLADAQSGRTLRDALLVGLVLVCVALVFWRRR